MCFDIRPLYRVLTPFNALFFLLLAWMVNRDEFPAEPRLALSVPLFELEKDFHCEQLN